MNTPEIDPELAALLAKHEVTRSGEADAETGDAAPKLKAGEKPPPWAIDENRFLTPQQRFDAVDKKDIAKRTGIRRFIRPENALVVVRRLPLPGQTTHCILKGDFVLADLIPHLLENHRCPHLRISTLSMNDYNAQLLAKLRKAGRIEKLTIVLSHYFEQVNKSTVYFDIRNTLEGLAEFVIMRSHAKVICMPRIHDGDQHTSDWLVLEGSANLRSSDNLEQMTIFNEQAVHDFHAEWIDHVLANPPTT